MGRYPSKIIERKLTGVTMQPADIFSNVAKLDRGDAAEFEVLRAAHGATPVATNATPSNSCAAGGYCLSPQNHPDATELIHDQFDSKREAWARGDEDAYREATPTDTSLSRRWPHGSPFKAP